MRLSARKMIARLSIAQSLPLTYPKLFISKMFRREVQKVGKTLTERNFHLSQRSFEVAALAACSFRRESIDFAC